MTRRVLIYLAVMAGIAAFSGLFIVVFGNSVEISCARDAVQAPDCRITKMLLGRVPVSNRDVLGVTDVQLDETCDDGCTYRVLLIASGGESVPLNDVYTDRGPVLSQMDAIDGFLNGTAKSFEYLEPVQCWVVGLVVGMDLMGMAIVAGIFLRKSMRG
jgi:hypothetical protein